MIMMMMIKTDNVDIKHNDDTDVDITCSDDKTNDFDITYKDDII